MALHRGVHDGLFPDGRPCRDQESGAVWYPLPSGTQGGRWPSVVCADYVDQVEYLGYLDYLDYLDCRKNQGAHYCPANTAPQGHASRKYTPYA